MTNSQNKKIWLLRISKILRRFVFVFDVIILCIAIALGFTYGILYALGSNSFTGNNSIVLPVVSGDNDIDELGNVEYDGKKYKINRDVVSMLVMGVDKENINNTDKDYGANGQADAIFLINYDLKKNIINVINISRDSITDVEVYSQSGAYAWTEKTQLCLSFAYGDGKEKSCENVVKSVSRMFYGINIDNYYAIDTSSVGKITNAVGGITVPEYTKYGEKPTGKKVTLWGDDALQYVRMRNGNILGSNISRMERQKIFLSALFEKVMKKSLSDIEVPIKLFNILSESSYTTLNASKITYLTSQILSSEPKINFLSVKGEVVEGDDGYAEYIVDQDALYELIIDCYYTEIE